MLLFGGLVALAGQAGRSASGQRCRLTAKIARRTGTCCRSGHRGAGCRSMSTATPGSRPCTEASAGWCTATLINFNFRHESGPFLTDFRGFMRSHACRAMYSTECPCLFWTLIGACKSDSRRNDESFSYGPGQRPANTQSHPLHNSVDWLKHELVRFAEQNWACLVLKQQPYSLPLILASRGPPA